MATQLSTNRDDYYEELEVLREEILHYRRVRLGIQYDLIQATRAKESTEVLLEQIDNVDLYIHALWGQSIHVRGKLIAIVDNHRKPKSRP